MRVPDENGVDKVEAMKSTYRYLDLDCLVVLGGNGSQKSANMLSQEGLNVVSLPKTIDNDLWGTDMTFGFQSAVDIATNAIDCIHTTAASHDRVFIVELMGHKVGWVTLHAGIAGGADVILIPEIPYNLNHVIEAIKRRSEQGKGFTILAVAEGAISKEDAKLSKKQYKERLAQRQHSTVGYELAAQIEEATGQEVRVTIPGHMQRGGSPVPFDRVISSRLGAAAAELIHNEDYGKMVIMKGYDISSIPLKETAGKLKYVSPGRPDRKTGQNSWYFFRRLIFMQNSCRRIPSACIFPIRHRHRPVFWIAILKNPGGDFSVRIFCRRKKVPFPFFGFIVQSSRGDFLSPLTPPYMPFGITAVQHNFKA